MSDASLRLRCACIKSNFPNHSLVTVDTRARI